MIDYEKLEGQLSMLPLYVYFFIDPQGLEFSPRIRWICENECPMYGKTWACPPGVGTVDACKEKCLGYSRCLMVGTITEPETFYSMESALATRPEHEMLTNQIRDMFREQGIEPYILSTEACAVCERCAIEDGLPCRMPGRMHPCLESHGINLIPTLEENGLEFQYGSELITWYSLLFFNE
jgi:predicted metal-binding protein